MKESGAVSIGNALEWFDFVDCGFLATWYLAASVLR
jgi:hypothetical protein